MILASNCQLSGDMNIILANLFISSISGHGINKVINVEHVAINLDIHQLHLKM